MTLWGYSPAQKIRDSGNEFPPNTQKSPESVSGMDDPGKSPPLRNNVILVGYAGPECVSANDGLLLYQNDGIAKG